MPSVAQNIKRKKAAKQYALLHGITLPKGFGVLPGHIGKPARELVRRIQRYKWPTLAPTGEFDEKTIALLFPTLPFGLKAIEVAKTQLGVKEDPAGSNSGPQVREYQHSTNPGVTGFPWCASFVTWCLRRAGWKVQFSEMAYVPAWAATALGGKNGMFVIPRGEVKAGDIATYDWNNDRIPDHIGFVLTPVNQDGSFKAREGNTSVGNDSNGGEVMDRDRNVSDVHVFIRLK